MKTHSTLVFYADDNLIVNPTAQLLDSDWTLLIIWVGIAFQLALIQ